MKTFNEEEAAKLTYLIEHNDKFVKYVKRTGLLIGFEVYERSVKFRVTHRFFNLDLLFTFEPDRFVYENGMFKNSCIDDVIEEIEKQWIEFTNQPAKDTVMYVREERTRISYPNEINIKPYQVSDNNEQCGI